MSKDAEIEYWQAEVERWRSAVNWLLDFSGDRINVHDLQRSGFRIVLVPEGSDDV